MVLAARLSLPGSLRCAVLQLKIRTVDRRRCLGCQAEPAGQFRGGSGFGHNRQLCRCIEPPLCWVRLRRRNCRRPSLGGAAGSVAARFAGKPAAPGCRCAGARRAIPIGRDRSAQAWPAPARRPMLALPQPAARQPCLSAGVVMLLPTAIPWRTRSLFAARMPQKIVQWRQSGLHCAYRAGLGRPAAEPINCRA